MISVRKVLVGLGLAFTAYLAARGLWWTADPVPEPGLIVAALGLYLVTTWLCILWEPAPPGRRRRSPRWFRVVTRSFRCGPARSLWPPR